MTDQIIKDLMFIGIQKFQIFIFNISRDNQTDGIIEYPYSINFMLFGKTMYDGLSQFCFIKQ